MGIPHYTVVAANVSMYSKSALRCHSFSEENECAASPTITTTHRGQNASPRDGREEIPGKDEDEDVIGYHKVIWQS